jgi:hypothetical protein
MTRLHLGFELGEGNRRDGPDANAGFAGERLEIGGHFRFLHAATPAVDIEDVFFRAPCEAESACGCRGGSELDGRLRVMLVNPLMAILPLSFLSRRE